ncbi:unnamed protein product [Heligmosomoides polygyrus]|uniref:Uncharacterized protein n=1 Tax=Heligmosomoides polygyrus TaxID=6339 RepID=A0A183FAE0_HELPZ|nr:unnamed protein product [Heligmosomoides polygyrus]
MVETGFSTGPLRRLLKQYLCQTRFCSKSEFNATAKSHKNLYCIFSKTFLQFFLLFFQSIFLVHSALLNTEAASHSCPHPFIPENGHVVFDAPAPYAPHTVAKYRYGVSPLQCNADSADNADIPSSSRAHLFAPPVARNIISAGPVAQYTCVLPKFFRINE